MNFPRVMIAGVQSGAGKTTLTLGIIAALNRRGIKVQPYKVGPDYIDPGLHYHASGIKSHNLDSWMSDNQQIKSIFLKNSQDKDISVVEGVMGLFDGARAEHINGSSAHIALILDIPVILVVNVKGMGRSCLAIIKGFKEFEPGLKLSGVILNNAGSDYYKIVLKKCIEEELGVKVLGCLPKNTNITMPERHLGLLPAEENKELKNMLNQMADMVEAEIDLDGIIDIAQSAENSDMGLETAKDLDLGVDLGTDLKEKVTIGIARDEAFSFYYQDSLDYLQELGASLQFFSPLNDRTIPKLDGLYLGGGFPEMFLDRLTNNTSMIASIKDAFTRGVPIFAECGGFMYLTKEIIDFEGKSWPGVGIVPACVRMTKRLKALGYVKATALNDSIIANKGDILKGHEFHYSEITGLKQEDAAYSLVGGKGADFRTDGYVKDNLTASYVHFHLRSNAKAAAKFVNACFNYKQKQLLFEGK